MYFFSKYFLTLLLVSSIPPDTFASGKCDDLTSKIGIDIMSHCKKNEMCDVKLGKNYDEHVKKCGTTGGFIKDVDYYRKCTRDVDGTSQTETDNIKNLPACFAKGNCTDSDIGTIIKEVAASDTQPMESVGFSCTTEVKITSPSNVEKVNVYVFAAALTLMSVSTFM